MGSRAPASLHAYIGAYDWALRSVEPRKISWAGAFDISIDAAFRGPGSPFTCMAARTGDAARHPVTPVDGARVRTRSLGDSHRHTEGEIDDGRLDRRAIDRRALEPAGGRMSMFALHDGPRQPGPGSMVANELMRTDSASATIVARSFMTCGEHPPHRTSSRDSRRAKARAKFGAQRMRERAVLVCSSEASVAPGEPPAGSLQGSVSKFSRELKTRARATVEVAWRVGSTEVHC